MRVPLSQVCSITMGQAPKGDTYNNDGVGLPLVAGAGDFGLFNPRPAKYTSAPTKISKVGDIVLCIRATIGDRNWSDRELCLGRGVAGLRASPEQLDQKYLWHWINHSAATLKAKGRGATFLQVSKVDIGSMEIPLPPLPEQRRIAAILDKADALRAQRREAIAKCDQLLQSVFLDMFGDPVTNPKGWPVVPLGEITTSRLGKMLDKKTSSGPDMKPYLANYNVRWGRFELGELRKMNFSTKDRAEFSLDDGDLLVCEGGEPGRCAIWRNEIADCYYQKALHRIRCDRDHCLPEYLQRMMWFLAQRGAFLSSVSSATIAHLTGVQLKRLQVPKPPLVLQQQFAQRCEAIAKERTRLEDSTRYFEVLFSSTQQRAFSGQLTQAA